MNEPYLGCMRHAWTDDGNVGCPSCASETKPAETVRPFLMTPAIIDWLQWCDELETPLGKPDYPQLALTLIAEYKALVAKLEAENARLKSVLKIIARNSCCDKCQQAALVAREALK